MSRYFAPVGGFADKNVKMIRMDSGRSYEILTDGSDRPCGYVGGGRVWRSTWGDQEIANLVKSGKWEELPAPQPAKVQAAPPAPVAVSHPEPVEPEHDGAVT